MRPDSNKERLLSPAASFFVDFDQDLISAGLGGKILAANTSTSILRDANGPMKEIVIQGASRVIIFSNCDSKKRPYHLATKSPMGRVAREDRWQWKIRSFRDAGRRGPTGCGSQEYQWLDDEGQAALEEHRTEAMQKTIRPMRTYLNWQNKLTDQQPGRNILSSTLVLQRCERCCSGDSIT